MTLNNPKNKILIDGIERMYGDKEFVATANERHERAKRRVNENFPGLTKQQEPIYSAALCLETAYPDDSLDNTELDKTIVIQMFACMISLTEKASDCNCELCNRQITLSTIGMKKLMAIYHSLPYKE